MHFDRGRLRTGPTTVRGKALPDPSAPVPVPTAGTIERASASHHTTVRGRAPRPNGRNARRFSPQNTSELKPQSNVTQPEPDLESLHRATALSMGPSTQHHDKSCSGECSSRYCEHHTGWDADEVVFAVVRGDRYQCPDQRDHTNREKRTTDPGEATTARSYWSCRVAGLGGFARLFA